MSGAGNPQAFGPRATLAMVLVGFVAFVVMLAAIGTGTPQDDNNSAHGGGAHGLGKGIIGYAALVAMLNAEGRKVEFNRTPAGAAGDDVATRVTIRPDSGDLRIFTPLPDADAKDIAKAVNQRRWGMGPTILVTPKWMAFPLNEDPRVPPDKSGKMWRAIVGAPRPPTGWSHIVGADTPNWKGFLDHVGVSLGKPKDAPAHGWATADGAKGRLPDDRQVLSGGGTDDSGHPLVPLIRSGDGRILAGYFDDGGDYPALERMAGLDPDVVRAAHREAAANASDDSFDPAGFQPLVIVFEPDLLNNYGLADKDTGLLAQRLVLAAADGNGGDKFERAITFDLSLAGLGATRSLLTLAFTPPFLAATICLILAMAGAIWRGFARFGPALAGAPSHLAGKVGLVSGGAALLWRARRYHLITMPYVEAARERLVVALGLPRRRDVAETDAAIARIQQAIAPGTMPFANAATRLANARSPAAITARAAELHAIEHSLGADRHGEHA